MSAPEDAAVSAPEDATLQQIKSMHLMLRDFSQITENGLLRLLKPLPSGITPVKLLDGEWLLDRAERLRGADAEERLKLALPRRQDLESSDEGRKAFMSLEELLRLHREMSADQELVKIGSPLPLLVVSHCWHDAPHPDPAGDNLLKLADAIQERRAVTRVDSRRRAAPEGRFAVFYDWCSLCQKDEAGNRAEDETEAFRTALARMQLLYAHQKTIVYCLTEQPLGWTGNRYENRGWPSFERMVTMLLKHHSHGSWQLIVDAANPERRPLPPMLPEEFDAMLDDEEQITFSNGTDKRLVSELYHQTLTVALGQTRTLRYAGLRWGDAEMESLVRVLPMCHALETLNLKGSHNAYTSRSAEILAEMLEERGNLPRLKCIGARCGAKGEGESTRGPLLGSETLQAICKARSIKLAADVALGEEKRARGSVFPVMLRQLTSRSFRAGLGDDASATSSSHSEHATKQQGSVWATMQLVSLRFWRAVFGLRNDKRAVVPDAR